MKQDLFIKTTAISLLFMSAPAHAGFFIFAIPIPKGSANPDALDATLAQRQNAMCAAFQVNAIDPTLSGKREATWRGEVAKAAQRQVGDYDKFIDLRNRYVRQWQLQAKNSYQAGMDYSKMLNQACYEVGLPQSADTFQLWKEIQGTLVQGQNAKDFKSEAEFINFKELFALEILPPVKLGPEIGKARIDVRILPNGGIDYCQFDKSSGNDTLDAFACNQLRTKGKFKPAVENLRYTVAYKGIEIDWPALYSSNKVIPAVSPSPINPSAPVAAKGVADPIMGIALQRCDAISGKRGTAAFKTCLSRQIELLSK